MGSADLRARRSRVSGRSTGVGDRRTTGTQSTFTRIPRIKVEYQLARPIFIRVVSQYSASHREPLVDPITGEVLLVGADTLFTPSALSASNALRTDWLFSYRPTPGTVFFFGYGGTLNEPDALAFDRLRRTGDGFFVKGSYVIQLGSSR